nr:SET and MYND domain-containing protein 4-like [Procambarus clarkii]
MAPVALQTTVTAEVHLPEDASAGVSASASDMVSAVPVSGEIVGVEDGYCSALFTEKLQMCCTVCVRRCMAPLPCPNCKMVIFCSEECRSQELSDIHWQECPIVETLHVLENGGLLAVAYKLMMKTSHAKFKEIIPLLQYEAKNQPPKNLGFNKNGIYDASDYRSVYHLTTNKDKLSSEELKICIQAFIVTKLLQLSGRYFLSCDGEPFTPSLEDIILTGSTLIHHIMIINCNSLCFSNPTLMNHSCNPNCAAFYYGITCIIRAMQFIPAGKMLTTSYGEDFLQHTRDSRRLSLMTRFHFTCTCEACLNNWPTRQLANSPTLVILKCTICNEGEGIDPITKCCRNCNLNYDQGSVRGRAPYNYSLICRKINKVHRDVFIATKNISEGSNSEKDIRAVRTLIKVFCKYVKQPNNALVDAIATLRYACFKRCSCVYVKHDIKPSFSII